MERTISFQLFVMVPTSIQKMIWGQKKKKYSKIVCKDGQWCIFYQQHVLYTNKNSLGNEPPRDGWSVVTGKGKQPAPICVIEGLQDNNISFDARDILYCFIG
jgi:hypothetical protein